MGTRAQPKGVASGAGLERGSRQGLVLGKGQGGWRGWVMGHNEVVTRGEGMLGVGGADTGTHTHTHMLAHTTSQTIGPVCLGPRSPVN